LVRAAEQALKAAETEQRNQLAAACLELAAAHAQATELRKEALPAAEEACVAARRAFDQGVATFLEVTDTRRALLSLRRDIHQAEVAAFDALLRAEGISDPRLTRTRALLVAE
jgi:outer membrane protein TolC